MRGVAFDATNILINRIDMKKSVLLICLVDLKCGAMILKVIGCDCDVMMMVDNEVEDVEGLDMG